MRGIAFLLVSTMLAACATRTAPPATLTFLSPSDAPTTSSSLLQPESGTPAEATSAGGAATLDTASSFDFELEDYSYELTSVSAPAPRKKVLGVGSSYTAFKVGPFIPLGDLETANFDTGFYGELTFGHKFLAFLAIEGTLGYLNTEGPASAKLWAIPAFVNARAQVPLLIFEVYGGLGVGGMYADYTGGSDFVGAFDAFLGASAGIGDLALGIEAEYLRSLETDDKFEIEGLSPTVFLSLPF